MQPLTLAHLFWRVLWLLLPLFSLGLFLPLAAHADGGAPNLAYVAGAGKGIAIIDVAQRRVTGTIPLGGDPHTVLLSPDGRFLYVTQPILGQVAVIAARTGQPICTANLPGNPALLALSYDATVLYVAGRTASSIEALDPMTCTIQKTFEIGGPVYGLGVEVVTVGSGVQNHVWVAGPTSLTILDENGQALASISIAGGPQYITIPGGLTAYITTRQGNVVAVDLETLQVLSPLLAGGTFGQMDYDAITGEIYVPDQQHNQLDVLAPVLAGAVLTPHEPDRVIHLSSSPQAIAITSDGQLGFAALSGGMVAMLDIPGRSIIRTIPVGGSPHFIITGLYPPPGGLPSRQQSGSIPSNSTAIALIGFALLIVVLLGILWLVRGQHSKRVSVRTDTNDED